LKFKKVEFDYSSSVFSNYSPFSNFRLWVDGCKDEEEVLAGMLKDGDGGLD